jgi:ribonuclease BN (tRNA processing enzyme)
MLKIALIPSAVSPGNGARGHFLTTYLVNEAIAIDAGSLGLIGDLAAQAAVTDVFLTHSHMDHIASLPLFLDTVFGGPTVTLHASAATLDSLRRDLFNDRVWPDLLAIQTDGRPAVRIQTLEPFQPTEVAGLKMTPVPVDHVVPTLGFLIESADGTSVAIPSDTGPTEEFWRWARGLAGLRAVFLECSFPDELGGLAATSQHLTPALFAAEARKLNRELPLIAVHIKPRYYDEVARQLGALGLPGVEVGTSGRAYRFGPPEGGQP